jgi:hypothetical protein
MPRRIINSQGVELHPVTVELVADVHKTLKMIAAEDNISLPKLLRGIIDQYVEWRYSAQQPVPDDLQVVKPPQ